jgi:hypothetical protein
MTEIEKQAGASGARIAMSEFEYSGVIYKRPQSGERTFAVGYRRSADEPEDAYYPITREEFNELPSLVKNFLQGEFPRRNAVDIQTAADLENLARLRRQVHEQVGGDHYRRLTPQPVELLKCWLTPEEFKGFLRGNIIKYLARYQYKGGVQDLEKAKQYLEWLIGEEK